MFDLFLALARHFAVGENFWKMKGKVFAFPIPYYIL